VNNPKAPLELASKKAGDPKHQKAGKSSLSGKSSILPTPITDQVKAFQCDKCQSNPSWKCIERVNVKGPRMTTSYKAVIGN